MSTSDFRTYDNCCHVCNVCMLYVLPVCVGWKAEFQGLSPIVLVTEFCHLEETML